MRVIRTGDDVHLGINDRTGQAFIEYPHAETALVSDEVFQEYVLASPDWHVLECRKHFEHYSERINVGEEMRKLALAEWYAYYGDE